MKLDCVTLRNGEAISQVGEDGFKSSLDRSPRLRSQQLAQSTITLGNVYGGMT